MKKVTVNIADVTGTRALHKFINLTGCQDLLFLANTTFFCPLAEGLSLDLCELIRLFIVRMTKTTIGIRRP